MKIKTKHLLTIIGVLLILIGIAWFVKISLEDYMAGQRSREVLEILDFTEITPEPVNEEEHVDMPNVEIDKYNYIGKIEIDCLNISLPVIDEWDYEKLETAPCRYSGSAYDDNMIIMGHSYKWHFRYLYNLKPGDIVKFTDIIRKVFTYEVVEVEIVQPYEGSKLTEGDYDLVVFTCKDQGSLRTIVRCKRIS